MPPIPGTRRPATRRPATRRRRLRAATVLCAAAVLTACTSASPPAAVAPRPPATTTAAASAPAQPAAPAVRVAPLTSGERWIRLAMPGGAYRPQAPAGGTDDYRCILLDPHLSRAAVLSGAVLQPGNPALVHHAILYRVDAAQVAAAKAKDAGDPRLGWSCFGGPGLPSPSGVLGGLDSAPWVAAWATRGGEQRFAAGTGQPLQAGSRLILQMHYNLLNGGGTDTTSVKLRIARPGARIAALQTLLLPAPVELPCPAGETGPLCARAAALADVERRFGYESGTTVAGLQLLCGGSLTDPRAGSTQSCTRQAPGALLIRAVAGHMHMLGKSIRIDLLRADGTRRNLLDTLVWNFDDQHATVLAKPVAVRPGDRLKVTCTHDATLRSKLPELRKLGPRYVVWGEGSSDEMCLGIVSYTR